MYMEKVFKRVVSAATPWTADTLPADANGNPVPPGTQGNGATGAMDNFINVRCFDTNGVPQTRLTVSYSGPGGAGTCTLTAYVWDRNTKQYYVTPDTAAGKTLTLGQLAYISVPAQADPPQNSNNSLGVPGNPGISRAVDMVLIITTASTANGTYVFGLAPGYGSAAQP